MTEKYEIDQCIRGRGGRGGRRSMMTDRGGTGKAANRRMTVCDPITCGACGGRSRRTSGGGVGSDGAC